MKAWRPDSWKAFPARQQPVYDDPGEVEAVLEQVRALPPLVVPEEVDHLRELLADAAQGRRFMLQGGDCAERFEDCAGPLIADKLSILLQMSVVLTHGGRIPVFQVGRIAGQYGKPRSADTERVGNRLLPVYRGDLVNGPEPTAAARRPDPRRMLEACFRAGMTLNHLRALVDGGFDDLHHPERWDLPWEGHANPDYQRVLDQVGASLDFLQTLGAVGRGTLRTGEVFTSHEALLLPWEEAQVRPVPGGGHVHLGAHMLWVGERTRQLGGAHLEFLRGLQNPLGLKVGPSMDPAELVQVLACLDPGREPGRITLITRLGAEGVRSALPPLIEAVQASGHPVLWSSDPMHGNGRTIPGGLKTRAFGDILRELERTVATHRAFGSRLGSVHVELTGEHVTECLGGPEGLEESDLGRAYRSGCDPRLNRSQSLELAFALARLLRETRKGVALAG